MRLYEGWYSVNTIGNPDNLTNQEQWKGLCELATNEHDQEKLGALFEGILRLVENQQVRLSTDPHEVARDHQR